MRIIGTAAAIMLQANLPPDLPPRVSQFLQNPQVNEAIAEAIRRGPPRGALLIPILVPLGAFALAAFIIWLMVRRRQAERIAMVDLQKQLLEKFSSGTDLAAFLASAGGQRFLDSMASYGGGTKQRIIRTVTAGVICAVLGLGFLTLSYRHGLIFPGVILLALGAGLLLSAAVTYRLSKKMDLLHGDPGGPPGPLTAPM